MIAALYVDPAGAYSGLAGVDCWGEERDARRYAGPWPVVAHPPCQRWSKYYFGSPRAPDRTLLGKDGGCFKSCLAAVRQWGGVLEHPMDSLAWRWFELLTPTRSGGWRRADNEGGWTCCVWQGHYGHWTRKPSWLYCVPPTRRVLPDLAWAAPPRQLDESLIERIGYEKARRRGALAARGGGGNAGVREASPAPFRDMLLALARSCSQSRRAA